MLSYFLVQHDESAVFQLDEDEWELATRSHPKLLEKGKIQYQPRSANAFIQPGKDNYFDNCAILHQFERLFILLKFKKSFANCKIEVIVDNARTHTAKPYDLNLLAKGSGTKCPYDKIEWIEDNHKKSIDCFFVSNKNKSKGLFVLAKELNLIDQASQSKDYTVPQLRSIFSTHPAFKDVSKLELLGDQYGVLILYCPKYHCELNPIEGLWCFMKNYVRKRTDQTFDKMSLLINQSVIDFEQKKTNMRLWNRFWRAIEMYHVGSSYQEVLSSLFGPKVKDKAQDHLRITNTFLS